MADRSDETRARAEAKFKKKEQQTQEAGKVWAERAAAEKVGDDKRAQLKSLRLAKEAQQEPSKQRRKKPKS